MREKLQKNGEGLFGNLGNKLNKYADGDTLDNGDYTTSFDYDQNGNMTDKDVNYVDPATPDEAWDFAYNEDDLLEAVVKDASTVAEYRYDPLGRRAFKKVVICLNAKKIAIREAPDEILSNNKFNSQNILSNFSRNYGFAVHISWIVGITRGFEWL